MFRVLLVRCTATLLTVAAATACSSKTPPSRVCCQQAEIPAGVSKFTIVADEVTGVADEQKVVIRAAVAQPITRDGVYPVLHTLYRHAMKRTAFEPLDFRADLYATEAAASRSDVTGRVASIIKGQRDLAPRCENEARYDLREQAERAFASVQGRLPPENPDDSCRLTERKSAARTDDGFQKQPTLKVDAGRRSVDVTHPYLELGKDDWVATLSRNAALLDWADYLTTMFRRVEDLQEVVYTGVHRDEPVLKISVTRAQFETGLGSLREEIASHAATTFALLGSGTATDKEAGREQEVFKTKVYKSALAVLPQGQVFVSPKLK